MKIAFIGLGNRIAQYFCLASGQFPKGITTYFYSENPKVRNLIRQSSHPLFPRSTRQARVNYTEGELIEAVGPKFNRARPRPRLVRRARKLAARLDHFFETVQPEAVFVWNGFDLVPSLAAWLANRRGITVLYGENGYLPNTMQIDPEGVNFFASFTRRIRSDIAVPLSAAEQRASREFIAQFNSGQLPRYTPAPGYPRASWPAKVLDSGLRLRVHLPKNWHIPREVPLPDRYVFLPLQVVRDSQLLFHSPLYGQNLKQLILDTHEALSELDSSVKLVVKLHPEDLSRTDYDNLAREHPGILFIKGMNAKVLAQGAEAVVTVNSTVGFESLLLGTSVICAGRNFYCIPELVHPLHSRRDFPECLESALGTHPNPEMVERAVHLLRHHYLANGTWKNHSAESYKAVAQKIVETLPT